MLTPSVAATALASALALISLGGGLYEFRVVDRAWPRRPDLIQPARGGVSRRGFWIPAHVAFELHPKSPRLPPRRSSDGRRRCCAQLDAAKRLAPAVGRGDLRGDAGRLCGDGTACL